MPWRLLAFAFMLAALAPLSAIGGPTPAAVRRSFDVVSYLNDVYTRYGRSPYDTWLSTVDDSYSEGRYSGWVMLSICCVNSSQQPHSQQELLNQLLVWQREGVVTITDEGLLDGKIQLAVAPPVFPLAKQKLDHLKLEFEVVSEDVEELISRSFSRFRASKIVTENFFELHEVEDFLKELQRKYPDQVKLKVVGESVMKRPILEITVLSRNDMRNLSDSQEDEQKNSSVPIILIDSATHAREWLTVATSLYTVQTMLENPGTLIREVEWRFIPVVNPDGYFYSWEKNRLWRKNRQPHPESHCVGVDINRNFDTGFGGIGSSHAPCSEEHHGEFAFSEPEAQAVRNAVSEAGDRLKMYLSLHSFGQLFLLPWAYSADQKHGNLHNMTQLAQGMADAIHGVNETKYFVGTIWEGLYPASGISSDWVAGQGVPNSIVVELQDKGRNGFLWPESEIEQAVTETYEGMKFMGEEIWRRYVNTEYGTLSPNIPPVINDGPIDVNAAIRDRIISLLEHSVQIIAEAGDQLRDVENPSDEPIANQDTQTILKEDEDQDSRVVNTLDVPIDDKELLALVEEVEDRLFGVESPQNARTNKPEISMLDEEDKDQVHGLQSLQDVPTEKQEISTLVEDIKDQVHDLETPQNVPTDKQKDSSLDEEDEDQIPDIERPLDVPTDKEELPMLIEEFVGQRTGDENPLDEPIDDQEASTDGEEGDGPVSGIESPSEDLPDHQKSLTELDEDEEDNATTNSTEEITVVTQSNNNPAMDRFVPFQKISSLADNDDDDTETGAVSIVTLVDNGTSSGSKDGETEHRNATANTDNDLNFVLLENFVPQVVSWNEKLAEECNNDTDCKISSYIKNVLENRSSRLVAQTSEIPETATESKTDRIPEETGGRRKIVLKLV